MDEELAPSRYSCFRSFLREVKFPVWLPFASRHCCQFWYRCRERLMRGFSSQTLGRSSRTCCCFLFCSHALPPYRCATLHLQSLHAHSTYARYYFLNFTGALNFEVMLFHLRDNLQRFRDLLLSVSRLRVVILHTACANCRPLRCYRCTSST